jgi:hypothetical protein
MTIEELRAQGFTVQIKHLRRWRPMYRRTRKDGTLYYVDAMLATTMQVELDPQALEQDLEFRLDPCGGMTIAVILRDAQVVASGSVDVHPLDNYCKRTGRVKALGRAVSALQKNVDLGALTSRPTSTSGPA